MGNITITADGDAITAMDFTPNVPLSYGVPTSEVIKEAVEWLDDYFSGKEPKKTPKLKPVGSEFSESVWALLCEIPYGTTITYGSIAKRLEERRRRRASAQAVGGAVGRNPIPIMIPCHRVVGANGWIGGFSCGIDKKIVLLQCEKVDVDLFNAIEKK